MAKRTPNDLQAIANAAASAVINELVAWQKANPQQAIAMIFGGSAARVPAAQPRVAKTAPRKSPVRKAATATRSYVCRVPNCGKTASPRNDMFCSDHKTLSADEKARIKGAASGGGTTTETAAPAAKLGRPPGRKTGTGKRRGKGRKAGKAGKAGKGDQREGGEATA